MITTPQSIHILCPKPVMVRFVKQKSNQGWNYYKASGFIRVTQGNIASPLMVGYTPSSQIDWSQHYEVHANYLYGNLDCGYRGNKDYLLLSYSYLGDRFKDCRFSEGDSGYCDRGLDHCELVCQQ